MNFFWKYLINYHTSVVYLYNKCVKYHNYHICGNCVVINGGSHDFSYLPSHPNFQYLNFQWVASTASSSLQQPPITSTSSDSCSTLHELFKNITIKPTKKCWFLDDLRPFDDLRRPFSGSPKFFSFLFISSEVFSDIKKDIYLKHTYFLGLWLLVLWGLVNVLQD